MKRNERVLMLRREQSKRYRKKYPQRKALQNKIYRIKHRVALMKILGGVKCSVCGLKDYRALQIDHINGYGIDDHKKHKTPILLTNYYLNNPEIAIKTLQVLCANHNYIKAYDLGEVRRDSLYSRYKPN